MNDKEKRADELLQQIESSPVFQLTNNWKMLNEMFKYTLYSAFILIEALEKIEKDKNLSGLIVSDILGQEESILLMDKMTTRRYYELVLNQYTKTFCSSFYSFVEYSRRIFRKDEVFLSYWNEESAIFKSDPSAMFLRDLRNIAEHSTIPFYFKFNASYLDQEKFLGKVYIEGAKMKDAALNDLTIDLINKASQHNVYFKPLIKNYIEMLETFWKSIQARRRDFLQEERKVYFKLWEEYNSIIYSSRYLE